jgi:glycosyltransferase involved in cell wall biosynthesis
VVVVPSRATPRWIEVTPRAALDAMAHGLAVVGSAAGAIPETIGNSGLVVPEEDVGALADVLQRLHDDPAEHQRLGAAGRRRVMDAYTDAAIAERTLAFWRDLIRATA